MAPVGPRPMNNFGALATASEMAQKQAQENRIRGLGTAGQLASQMERADDLITVGQALQALEGTVAALTVALEELEDRLGPILRPPTPSEEQSDGSVSPNAACEIAGFIDQQNAFLAAKITRLHNIRFRIAL